MAAVRKRAPEEDFLHTPCSLERCARGRWAQASRAVRTWLGRAAYNLSCIVHFSFGVVVQGPACWGGVGAGASDDCEAGVAGGAPGVPGGR